MKNGYKKTILSSLGAILLLGTVAYTTGFTNDTDTSYNPGFVEKKLSTEDIQRINESVSGITNEYGTFEKVEVLPPLEKSQISDSVEDVNSDTLAIVTSYANYLKQ